MCSTPAWKDLFKCLSLNYKLLADESIYRLVHEYASSVYLSLKRPKTTGLGYRRGADIPSWNRDAHANGILVWEGSLA